MNRKSSANSSGKICSFCKQWKKRIYYRLRGKDRPNQLKSLCKECEKIKAKQRYYEDPDKHKEYRQKYYSKNKEKLNQKSKEWYKNNKTYHQERYESQKKRWKISGRKNRLWRKFKLTIEEYEILFKNQNGVCAICKNPETRIGYRLAVDHNHLTGKVRGLLCKRCNRVIGFLRDGKDFYLIEEMKKYLHLDN